MQKQFLHILIHIVSCLALLSLPVLFNPERHLTFDSIFNPFAQRDFICFILLIGFFYLNYFLLIPKYYLQGNQILFIVFVLIGLVIVIGTPELYMHHYFSLRLHEHHREHDLHEHHEPSVFFLFSRNIFLFFIALLISLFIKITGQLKKTEKEKLKAELSFLRAQINPHFLFNTLNSIYSLALQKSDKTPQAVVSLSNLMRYVTTDTHKDFVELNDEIIYIKNYINLQVLRLGETAKINFQLIGNMENQKIAPIILIPFVENAFKYGVNPEKNSLIQITIKVEESVLNMTVYNLKVNHAKETEIVSGHGVKNTVSRLQVLYPHKHLLSIKDEPNDYTVTLQLNLK